MAECFVQIMRHGDKDDLNCIEGRLVLNQILRGIQSVLVLHVHVLHQKMELVDLE
jgi:hypothetical protein